MFYPLFKHFGTIMVLRYILRKLYIVQILRFFFIITFSSWSMLFFIFLNWLCTFFIDLLILFFLIFLFLNNVYVLRNQVVFLWTMVILLLVSINDLKAFLSLVLFGLLWDFTILMTIKKIFISKMMIDIQKYI